MARSKNSKNRYEDKKRAPESGMKLAVDNWSITALFKPEDLQEISSLLEVTRLDDSHLLLGAVALSRFDIVKQLLRKKFPINSHQDGTTPLLLAVKLKLIEMADFLVRKGADLCQSDAEGNNALLLAAQHADWNQESFLDFWNRIKEINVDINHANKVGHSILHCLVKRNWTAAIDSVINQAASLNINNVTSKGVTALMMASSRHRDAIIKTLLSSKANRLLEDQRGCTALCYAIAYFIQKRMDAPSQSMQQLMVGLESGSSLYSYLNRRLELLAFPPEENFATTLSTVIVNIITFTVQCLDSGMEMLLHLSAFKRIKAAAESQMHDDDYLQRLLEILTEVVRHYNCCYTYESKEKVMAQFFEADMPNLCLRILNNLRYPTFKAMLPIILTSSHSRMRYWLQKNFISISELYKSCTYENFPPLNFYPDEAHCQMVKKNNVDFKVLMNRLERGEAIKVADKANFPGTCNYLPRSSAVAAKPLERGAFCSATERNEGEDLFQMPAKDIFGYGDTTGCCKYGAQNNGYRKTLDDLTERLYNYLSKFERKWQTEFEEGYPDVVGDVDDYLQLMERLPAIEAGYINLVMSSWKNLVDKLNREADNEAIASTMADLQQYIDRLEEEELLEKINLEASTLHCRNEDLVEKDHDSPHVLDLPLHLISEPWGLGSNDLLHDSDILSSSFPLNCPSPEPETYNERAADSQTLSNEGRQRSQKFDLRRKERLPNNTSLKDRSLKQ